MKRSWFSSHFVTSKFKKDGVAKSPIYCVVCFGQTLDIPHVLSRPCPKPYALYIELLCLAILEIHAAFYETIKKKSRQHHSVTTTTTRGVSLASSTNDQPKKSVFREYAEAIIIALVLALFIRTFVIQAFKIPSGSMIPTLLIGDHILVSKFIYGIKNPLTGETWIEIKQPKKGDVIVFKYPVNPKLDFIKRVVGVAGDRLKMVNKKLYVNDSLVELSQTQNIDPTILPGSVSPRDNFGPITVPPDSLFVMGDNRDNSHDSRFWKFVRLKEVKGKALILYWSWNKEDFAVRWSRIFNLIH